MASHTRFEKLLEPGYIGPVKTRNRIVKSGAAMLYWHEDDLQMNERVKCFYDAIARGGVGMLIVESPVIDYPLGARWRRRYRLDDDKYIKGLSELTKIIHSHGCPTFMQMFHDAPWQTQHWEQVPINPGPPAGASPVVVNSIADFHNEETRELTIPEIEEIVDKFASAAVRAEKAGFDGVDINSASSHLLHNFLSPFWNRRQDAYGGSLENRARLVVSVVREIKKRLGGDFPITVCIDGIEIGQLVGIDDDKCLTSKESQGIAQLLQEAGADAIQVRSEWLGYHSAGFFPEAAFYPELIVPAESFPKELDQSRNGAGALLPLAAAVKKVVSVPVLTVGRYDPELGEKVLQEGKADFIAMTRRLLADPELPNKIAQGRLDDIRPCTACQMCLEPRPIKCCRINAALGSDEPYIIKEAGKRKRVVIVGGGPSGMEAARVAALRGHEVLLYEKESKLGGLLPVAALVKGLEIEDLPAIVKYLKTQIEKLGVKVKLNTEVTAELIEELKPDAVILATGGETNVPDIPGISNRNVVIGTKLHKQVKTYLKFFSPKFLRWLTKFYLPIGKKVVIIGGDIQGCELAEFLTKRGRNVTIVDTAQTLGEGMGRLLLIALTWWFQKKGVTTMTEVQYGEITDKGLTVITKEGDKQTIEADTIVSALPLKPNAALFTSLEGKVPEVYAIGDCEEPRLIVDAIADGYRVAKAL
jgi:2,4-dienoyl-CoA reductase (NADPH2)